MQWHMFILFPDDDVGEMSIKNLIEDLSQRFRESNLPPKFKVYLEGASGVERHYFFTPKVSELAKDILGTYRAFPVSAPESIENMRQIVL